MPLKPFKIAVVGQGDWPEEDLSKLKLSVDSFLNIEKAKHKSIEINVFWQEPFSQWVIEKCEAYTVPYNVFLCENRESHWVTSNLGEFSKAITGGLGWVSDEIITNSDMAAIFHQYENDDESYSVIHYIKKAHMYVVEPLNNFFGDKYPVYDQARP